ncbi:ABC transporter substrate-binding protein [Pigmentibacter sp. JX0631]|uniref:ABC transporter substrate-binding protein n=1 Tax=Pigmentibacter sp. JX0631 TaxID=2976982 RepID=UPI0024691F8D|nr:ABC transporter substrate-binding protein [Pigmentibacter sp. JX0631]WGL61000.1 ABC transporter substrate-binding protein [Pigmentibacter sp. JX0631]
MQNFKLNKRKFLTNFAKGIFYPWVLKSSFSNANSLCPSKMLKINLSDIPQIPWDIEKASWHVLSTFHNAVHGSLFEHTNSKKFLIEKAQYKNNKLILYLKKGIFFHNEREVNAYDVEFSFYKDLLNYPKHSFTKNLMQAVQGIEQLNLANICYTEYKQIWYPSNFISGIKVIDPYTLAISLHCPDYYLLNNLNNPRLPIVPIEELNPNDYTWKQTPIGYGEYQVHSYNHTKSEYILKKISPSNGKTPHFIQLQFHDKNIADIYVLYRYRLQNKLTNFINIKKPYFYANNGFLYNYQSQLGCNINFRKAISYAINRCELAKKAFKQEIVPENYFIPKKFLLSKQSEFEENNHSYEKALHFLNMVPKNLWQNKVLQVPTILDYKNIQTIPYLQMIKHQLKTIGLQIEFLETNLNYDKFIKNDNNHLWFTGFALDKNNLLKNFLHFVDSSYFEYEQPSDPTLAHLIEKAFQTYQTDPHYLQILSKYFKEQEYMTVLFNTYFHYSYNPKTVKSLGKQIENCSLTLSEIEFF